MKYLDLIQSTVRDLNADHRPIVKVYSVSPLTCVISVAFVCSNPEDQDPETGVMMAHASRTVTEGEVNFCWNPNLLVLLIRLKLEEARDEALAGVPEGWKIVEMARKVEEADAR